MLAFETRYGWWNCKECYEKKINKKQFQIYNFKSTSKIMKRENMISRL